MIDSLLPPVATCKFAIIARFVSVRCTPTIPGDLFVSRDDCFGAEEGVKGGREGGTFTPQSHSESFSLFLPLLCPFFAAPEGRRRDSVLKDVSHNEGGL